MRTSIILACAVALLAGCEDKTPPTWEGDGLLEATVEGTSVRLSWPVANENDALREHRVLQDGEEIAIVGASVREYLVEGLEDATTYELTVEAVDESGNHSEPLHATATTADETGPHWIAGAALRVEGEPPPELAEGEEPAAERAPAVLEWDRAEDASSVASYKVMAGETALANVTGLRHELGRPLEAGERETFAIVAVDDAGNESAPLRWRAEAAGAANAPAVADAQPLEVPQVELADPTAAMPPQVPANVKLSPAQSAIIDRVRRMGIRRPVLERSAIMLREPQAQ